MSGNFSKNVRIIPFPAGALPFFERYSFKLQKCHYETAFLQLITVNRYIILTPDNVNKKVSKFSKPGPAPLRRERCFFIDLSGGTPAFYIMLMNEHLRLEINRLASLREPFIFVIDFEAREPYVKPLASLDGDILYSLRGAGNSPQSYPPEKVASFDKDPVPFERYSRAFDLVNYEQRSGNSYLLNLTFPTAIQTGLSLSEIFHRAAAPYRLMFKDRFVVFSPEPFVRIENGIISSYPMKGTIDALTPDAENLLIYDEKEFAEHLTIVDLIRNDLNSVARNVIVEKFRYVEKIRTSSKDLLQTSSAIKGELPHNYNKKLGDILLAMLPAGSVTGAPKKKTVEIIKRAEGYERGFYTGVFGVFDGENLDSAVMIRFIENTPDGLVYKSGGGITVYSDCRSEYEEMIDKVYVPSG